MQINGFDTLLRVGDLPITWAAKVVVYDPYSTAYGELVTYDFTVVGKPGAPAKVVGQAVRRASDW